MKRWMSVLLLSLTGFLMGMAACDVIFGVERDPKTGEVIRRSGGSPADAAGGLLGLAFPWAAAAISAAGNVYYEIRRRNWRAAAESTYQGINDFRKTQEGAAVEAKLMEILKGSQERSGIRDFVRDVVHRVEGKRS